MTDILLTFALEQESQDLFNDYPILYTGVGKIRAAYQLSKYIHKTKPKLVVNLGTAGSSKFDTGSIVHCTQFVQRDMDASPLGFSIGETPFSNEPVLLEHGRKLTSLPHGICGSGDSFDISHNIQRYDVADMEAFALAWICKQEEIDFVCLKYISDGANGNAPKDWSISLKNAANFLKKNLYEQVLL